MYWELVQCQDFNTKEILRGTLMKTEPITEAKQMKQFVYNIPCDVTYFSKTSSPVEVHFKEHKYSFTQGLLETSKLAHMKMTARHVGKSKGPAN
jgi:hypothetical protein